MAFAADTTKVLRVASLIPERTLDPALVDDVPSGRIVENIFDRLLEYDYLARPAKLRPSAAMAMPAISPDGLTHTFHIKPGIYFTADAAFNGHRRELTAADYAYSIKRRLDPNVRSPRLDYVEGKFVGADAAMRRARRTGHFDYDANIPGIQVAGRYTL